MRKTFTLLKSFTLFFVSLLGCITIVTAQEVDSKTASNLVKQNAAAIGLSASDLQNFRISSAGIDKVSGATMVYVQQTYKGIDVLNAIQSLAFKNGKLVSVAGRRIGKIYETVNSKDGKASVSAADAVKAAAAHLKLIVPGALNPLRPMNEAKEIEFGNLGISSVNIKSKLIWVNDEKANKTYLSWQVTLQPNAVADYWLVNVDALKGTVINKINLNIACNWTKPVNPYKLTYDPTKNDFKDESVIGPLVNSARYRVVRYPAESPQHPGGTPALQQNPWLLAGAGNNATTLQWNDNGTTTFDSTRGNNVLAQEDVNGNNGSGKGARSSTALPDLTFNFKPNFSKAPTDTTNQRFAITNLFYWNNIIHDLSYQYGFDEASGNFQANNIGRGAAGNDYVLADAQDGSGSNNANFSTPADGNSPRMQMFLFNAVPSLIVKKPAPFAGSKTAVESGFSTNNKLSNVGPVSGRVVLYADNAADTSHRACAAAFNAAALNGKIALIDRGDCNFTVKVKNAQNAGAIAAIVADNNPGEYPIIMGGTDNTITIPAVMVSFETGDSMKQVLAITANLSVVMQGGVSIDGDLDNGVISHEYTHGISNRLTGGRNNVSCLNNAEQMGEGWSDYMGLMATTNWATATINDGPNARPIGTYVLGQATNGPGIRTHPYSTNIAVDSWTYADLPSTGGEPHNVGEIWCTMVWEMTWDIIQQIGSINTNLYNVAGAGGNSVALQLVMTGMKLQPCSPGFVDGRNAILKADTLLYGGTFSASIWQAFAKRGLGVNASQGSSNNINDGVADFTVPPIAVIAKTSQQQANAILQKQNMKENYISISPNPAKDKVMLTVSGNNKPLTIRLVTATGHELKNYIIHGEMLQLNVSNLSPGMYYIRINGDGIAETRKVIIQ